MRAFVVAAAALLFAGCVEEVADEGPVQVAGRPDGTAPTNVYLKSYVESRDYTHVVGFERAEWYVAGLEKELLKIDFLVVEGTRQFDGEVVAVHVTAPDDVERRYKYDEMGVDGARREEMDREWDARLAELAKQAEDATPLGDVEDDVPLH